MADLWNLQSAGPVEMEGIVEKILFSNEENHFAVFVLRPMRGNEEVAVGTIPEIAIGETLRVKGVRRLHGRHGWRIEIAEYERILPASEYGIHKYLSSGLVKGIGETLAGNLVKAFGANTLRVIDETPEQLLEVAGIGKKRKEEITGAWKRHRAVHNVMVFLHEHGVGTAYAQRIYKRFGREAAEAVKANPYVLAREIRGIGFRTADRIAQSLGIKEDSAERIEAGIEYVLEELAGEGHTCAPMEVLAEKAGAILNVAAELIVPAIDRAAAQGRVRVVSEQERLVYLPELYEAEEGLARGLERIGTVKTPPFGLQISRRVESVQRRFRVGLSDGQLRALTGTLLEKVGLVTGGPGVGKTTIVRALVEAFEEAKLKVVLAAPTGRAAKRLSEITGREAQTIHRLLKYNPGTGRFEANAQNPLEQDVFIIDEASMLDVSLARDLVSGIPDEARLVLVGDADQLPPVGPGKVFEDIIRSKRFAVFELTEVFRQELTSDIVRYAHEINSGRVPRFDEREGRDFFFIEQGSPTRAVEVVKALVTKRIPERFGMDAVRDIQVLAPMHKGACGIEKLNEVLQEALNPRGLAAGAPGMKLRIGDRVMQTVNNYDKEVFNGDVGRVASVNRIKRTLAVEMGGRTVEYEWGELEELTLAYAVSIHKSQGSEYRAVVLALLPQHYMMLSRKLLYTAVTRGKELVVIVGTREALKSAVENARGAERYTRLAERLAPG
ncbi:MAG: ATP-dependent RecD-like DNA helicase [Planctomycetota bacterium]